MNVDTREITVEVAGRAFTAFLADGSGGKPSPGIVVAHEGRGFTQHPRDRAVMLAELGYVAVAPDYFGEPTRSLDHAFGLMKGFLDNPQLYVDHGRAALAVLRAHPHVDAARLAAIGFCWGGYAVFELACYESLRCVIGFHPGLSLGPLSKPEGIACPLLVCVGDQDPHVPVEARERFIAEMNAAGVDCQIQLILRAPHSFTNPEPYHYELDTAGIGYDARADRHAWSAMKALFAETLA